MCSLCLEGCDKASWKTCSLWMAVISRDKDRFKDIQGSQEKIIFFDFITIKNYYAQTVLTFY